MSVKSWIAFTSAGLRSQMSQILQRHLPRWRVNPSAAEWQYRDLKFNITLMMDFENLVAKIGWRRWSGLRRRNKFGDGR